jgi:hypothetical protein
MPAFYKIDKERRIVMSTGSGVLTKEDWLFQQDRLLNDPEFDPSFSQLCDFASATRVDLTPADIREIAQRNIFAPHSRRAFLVRDEFAYGLTRMFELLRESQGEVGIRVFRELDNALDWLLAPDAAV